MQATTQWRICAHWHRGWGWRCGSWSHWRARTRCVAAGGRALLCRRTRRRASAMPTSGVLAPPRTAVAFCVSHSQALGKSLALPL